MKGVRSVDRQAGFPLRIESARLAVRSFNDWEDEAGIELLWAAEEQTQRPAEP